MSEVHHPSGYGKKRHKAFETAIQNEYGKSVTVHAENRIVHGGRLSNAIRWLKNAGKEVIINECCNCSDGNADTECVEVTYEGEIKHFWQGEYSEGDPGTEEDYHGLNAYLEAEKYAIGLL